MKDKAMKFKPVMVWATWRGPGFVPCLWGPKVSDIQGRDVDEFAIRVRVTLAHTTTARKRKR